MQRTVKHYVEILCVDQNDKSRFTLKAEVKEKNPLLIKYVDGAMFFDFFDQIEYIENGKIIDFKKINQGRNIFFGKKMNLEEGYNIYGDNPDFQKKANEIQNNPYFPNKEICLCDAGVFWQIGENDVTYEEILNYSRCIFGDKISDFDLLQEEIQRKLIKN